jgi:FKBP-type peptidyl-prolyl cis-trans isomerase
MKKLIAVLLTLGLGMVLSASVAAAQTTSTTPAKKPPASSATTPAKTTTAKPAAKPAAKPSAPAAKPLTLTDPKQKFSYALGMNLATGLGRQGMEVDPDTLAQGIKDSLAGKTLITEDEERNILTQAQNDMRAKAMEKMKLESEANKKKGEEFLAANKAKPGVVTLPSGLQYKIVTEGTGPKPKASDMVVCNYRGTLVDGKEFDSSYKRGQPATFPVGGVIKGWTEALQLMPVGSKWELYLPSNLAYGEQQKGPDIGPNSTLVFEVELLSIEEKKAPEVKLEDLNKKPAPKVVDKTPEAKQPEAKPEDKKP